MPILQFKELLGAFGSQALTSAEKLGNINWAQTNQRPLIVFMMKDDRQHNFYFSFDAKTLQKIVHKLFDKKSFCYKAQYNATYKVELTYDCETNLLLFRQYSNERDDFIISGDVDDKLRFIVTLCAYASMKKIEYDLTH